MSDALRPRPTVVELKRDQGTLAVEWEDGHRSSYPIPYLRGFCPCAHCQGHGGREWNFVSVENPAIQSIEEIGNYALQIAFSEGHSTGIYTFEILRELCPCEACRDQQGNSHPSKHLPESLSAVLL